MITRVAIIYNFNDIDWHGGRNYFESLLRAVETKNIQNIEFIILTGHKTKTSLLNTFPRIKVYKSSMLDRLHLLWFFRQLTLKFFGRDPLLSLWVNYLRINIISHASNIGSPKGVKTIAWLRDFQFMHFPEYWDKKIIKKTEKWYRTACKNSDALIVSSYDALNDLKVFYANEKLPPVYVLQFTSKPVDFNVIESHESIFDKYQLPKKYIYLPNQFWAAKNHMLVVKALEICKQRKEDITVVCTGKIYDVRNSNHCPHLKKIIKQLGLEQFMPILGVIPYLDTVALMYHAHAVINPSKFEGWSTTVEEAKTHGKKLLLSDIAIHHEQCVNVDAIYFPIDDEIILSTILIDSYKINYPKKSTKELLDSYNSRQIAYGKKYLDIITSIKL